VKDESAEQDAEADIGVRVDFHYLLVYLQRNREPGQKKGRELNAPLLKAPRSARREDTASRARRARTQRLGLQM
jgi:hypothetical protein